MKRFGHLFERVCARENLEEAFTNARRGKRRRSEVCLFEKNLDTNLAQIETELRSHTYRTSDYTVFTKYEPKERLIYKLPFRDRVVHWAIMQVMEPIWRSVLTADVYACVRGRGIHMCMRSVRRDLQNDPEGTRYCLKLDIRKFYPSIDHATMKQVVRQKIKDPELLWLLDEIIDSTEGLPIGNYLSQYFANIYLAELDHLIKERLGARYYYRYADDMVLLAGSKEILHQWLAFIADYLLAQRRLSLKQNHQIFPVAARGIDFVGYVAYRTHCRARKRNKKSLCRTLASLRRRQMPEEQIRLRMASHLGFMKHCNSTNLINSLNMKTFSDVAKKRGTLTGTKMKIEEIIGRTIKLTAYEIGASRFRDQCLTLQFLLEVPLAQGGSHWVQHICFTGSQALMRQLDGVEIDPLDPPHCQITRHPLSDGRNFLSLSDPRA